VTLNTLAKALAGELARAHVPPNVMADRFSPNPGTAAVLSFFIPGLGQFYNGKFLRGIFWLIVTPGLWIGSGGTLGWICHVVSAYTAYAYAKKHF
jgi:TM2 domain-containing membrane protein YozV